MTEEPRDPSNIRENKKEFERLLASPAWRMIAMSVQAQIDSLQQEVLFATLEGPMDLYMLERKKGALEGRLSLQATADAMLEDLVIDLERAKSEEN